MSRVLVLVIACCIVTGMAAGLAHAADPSATVPFSTWGDEAIGRLAQAGIIVGLPSGYYGRDAVMTRYEFAAGWARFVEKLGLGQAEETGAKVTMDVPAGHWARPAVERLVVAGVLPVSAFCDVAPTHWAAGAVAALDGAGARRLEYRGDAPLLRQEYAEVACRTCSMALGGRWKATADEVGYDQATRYLRELGVLIGYPDGREYMTRRMTRMEFVLATDRSLERLKGMVGGGR